MDNKSTRNFNINKLANRVSSVIFAILGVLAIVLVIYICSTQLNTPPKLTFSPELPQARVKGFMESMSNGEYSNAEEYLIGQPDLGASKVPSDEIGAMIWQEFVNSTDYSLSGSCYATDDGLAQNVTYTYLDISSVTANLRERSQALLKDRINSAKDVSEIYDENNEYRSDLVNEVLVQAVKDALKEDAKYITTEITINLKYQDNQWWVEPDQALLDVLFGDVLFYSY